MPLLGPWPPPLRLATKTQACFNTAPSALEVLFVRMVGVTVLFQGTLARMLKVCRGPRHEALMF